MNETVNREIAEVKNEENQYVTFCIGKELYGIEVMRASEVMYLAEVTEVPDTLPFMKGVMDLRGTIVPLVDVRTKFKLQPKEYDTDTVTIIIEYDEERIGLIVDSVSDVLNLSLDDIQETTHFANDINQDYVKGISKVGERLVIVLDVDRIFSNAELERITSGSNDFDEESSDE